MSTSRPDPERPESATAPTVTNASEGQPVSLAVVEAVAAISGRPQLHDRSTADGVGTAPLAPLNDAIDPDALNALCRSGVTRGENATTVTFAYCGFDVTVESTGKITVVESGSPS